MTWTGVGSTATSSQRRTGRPAIDSGPCSPVRITVVICGSDGRTASSSGTKGGSATTVRVPESDRIQPMSSGASIRLTGSATSPALAQPKKLAAKRHELPRAQGHRLLVLDPGVEQAAAERLGGGVEAGVADLLLTVHARRAVGEELGGTGEHVAHREPRGQVELEGVDPRQVRTHSGCLPHRFPLLRTR